MSVNPPNDLPYTPGKEPFANRLYFRRFRLVLAVGLAAAIAAGLYYSLGASAEEAAPAALPAPKVEVAVLAPQEIRSWTTFSGRLTPVESAAIKPLVSGTIQKVLFQEGQVVQQGDPLFVIDPRPHEAELQRAEAELTTARSRAKLSSDELRRAQQLFDAKLISGSIFDAAVSDQQVAQAAVQVAVSALRQARLNVEYAYVRAPISGRTGRAELTVGNVVDAGPNAPTLTSIVADDRFYAEFNVDERTYIQSVRSIQQQQQMPVELTLALAGGTAYQGHIHAFDNRLDTGSGTIRARAIFDNVDGVLTSGMYANVRVGSAATSASLLVPDRAIGTNQDKKFVYVVDDTNTVNYREVTLGDHYQSHRVVLNGLTAGERVAVNSLSHLRPSTVIDPVTVDTLNHLAAK